MNMSREKINIRLKDSLLLPNIISEIRILMIIPSVYFFFYFDSSKFIILALALFSILLDNLDGYLARKLNQISELGKILDPIADKILIGAYTVGLYANEKISMWILFLIVGRDILIIFGSMLFVNKAKFIIPSNRLGKITAFYIAIYLVLVLVEFNLFINYNFLFNILLIILVLSNLTIYLIKGISLHKK